MTLIFQHPDGVEISSDELEKQKRTAENDLVQEGVYEGGNVTWECSADLVAEIRRLYAANHAVLRKPDMLYVLELGCGSALPTRTLIELRSQEGLCTTAVVQDLNLDVLVNTTRPNLKDFQENPNCCISLVPADWTKFIECRRQSQSFGSSQPFDLLLSSETLYRDELFPLLTDFLQHLMSENPALKIFLAQKKYYFGLGGGSIPYRMYLRENKKPFSVVQLANVEDGLSNIREVIELEGAQVE